MKIGRIIDLSHRLYPGKEEYKLEIKTSFVDELLPGYVRPKDAWYIMQEVNMWTHAGTHLESPMHYIKDGKDVSEIPLKQLIGEAVILDFTDKKPGEAIGLEEIIEKGKNIREGDMVLIKTGLDKYFRTEKSHERPYLTTDAVKFLVQKKISCLGTDASGFEVRGIKSQPNHEALFKAGIPVIEWLTNLSAISSERVTLFVLPWNVKGLESSPVRVIAIEEG